MTTPQAQTPLLDALTTAFTAQPTSQIRIYVACLAAYNNAHLQGRWIDATLGESHITEQTRAMLAASPIEGAEEWAIHDYEIKWIYPGQRRV